MNRRYGRRMMLTPEQVAKAKTLRDEHGVSVSDLARRFGVARATMVRALDRQDRRDDYNGDTAA